MVSQKKCVTATLLIFIATIRYVGISSALAVPDSCATKEQANDNTTISSGPTLANCSSENCDTIHATDGSDRGRNITSNGVTVLSSSEENSGLWSYAGICLGIWAVVANALPLAAIITQEQLHKPVYILMANLAASDVLTGLSTILATASRAYVVFNETTPSDVMLHIRLTALVLSGMSSAYSLMALTAERYWFIVHGMTYVNNVTNGKCKVVVVLVWVWSTLMAILPNFDWHCEGRFDPNCIPLGTGMSYNYAVVILVFVFIPMAAIILLNMCVLWCLWKHVNAIAAQEAAVGAEPSTSRKSAITVVLITVMFLVGWMPFAVRLSLFTQSDTKLTTMLICVLVNSSANPVIYGFRLREVRRGVVRLFRNANPAEN
ncbi:lysophosphatidic acid receptor 1-like [Branchiostoma floridae]|uniref:Lysophosphatidic acid receptor 1-like n=1 Tax=Branchiostoma floridae TaxID=7739 RepID=A0A9J7NBB6_BRAFL|nr:lysophosphatidic acid receptor 1-like [Branchiostoma floridae]